MCRLFLSEKIRRAAEQCCEMFLRNPTPGLLGNNANAGFGRSNHSIGTHATFPRHLIGIEHLPCLPCQPAEPMAKPANRGADFCAPAGSVSRILSPDPESSGLDFFRIGGKQDTVCSLTCINYHLVI